MRQRGRKSAANLAIIGVEGEPPRLDPPATLSDDERTLFTSIIAATAPGHFRPSDLPLLVSFVQAAVLNEQAARELQRGGAVVDGKPSAWIVVQEKCTRALVSLSLRLRLAPQSRIDSKTVGRHQQQFHGPPPWAREEEV